jgi:hypothetical protein
MDFLKNIISIINKRRLQNIELLDKNLIAAPESVLSKLYEGISNGNIKTDTDAVLHLYEEVTDTNTKNYRQIKARFKKRLLNTIFFLDISNIDYDTDIQKHYYECCKYLQVINIIQKFNGNQILIYELISDYYGIAQKHNFYDILCEFDYKLITYYSLKGNTKALNQSIKNFDENRKNRKEIEDVYIIFCKLNGLLAIPKKPSKDEVKNIFNEIKPYREKQLTYLGKCYVFLCELMYYDKIEDMDALEQTCNLFLNFIDTKDNMYRQSFKGISYHYIVSVMLQKREYNKGILYINKNIDNFFGINWFEAMDIKLKFALNLKDLDTANNIIETVFSQKMFDSLPANIKEKWYINEGYTVFYDSYLNNGSYKFNVGKLINNVQSYYHDKSGYNFSIIILQLLYNLVRNNKENMINILTALRSYKSRYIKDIEQHRTAEFIRILFYFEKNSFNKKRTGSLSLIYKNNVKENSYIHEHEIISYEVLLDIIFLLA